MANLLQRHMFEFPPERDTAGYVSSGRPRPAGGGGVVKTRENFTVISKSGRRRLQEVVV